MKGDVRHEPIQAAGGRTALNPPTDEGAGEYERRPGVPSGDTTVSRRARADNQRFRAGSQRGCLCIGQCSSTGGDLAHPRVVVEYRSTCPEVWRFERSTLKSVRTARISAVPSAVDDPSPVAGVLLGGHDSPQPFRSLRVALKVMR